MITIYDEFTEDFYNNGLGIIKDCIDPIVKEELNGIFELQFNYPVNSKKREYLKNKNIIKCDCGYDQKQLFKIVRVKPDLENVTVYAQHITYDLASNMLEDVYPQNLNGANALDWIFSRTQYEHKFKTFSDIVKISTARYVRKNPLEAILGNDENSFVNRWGGELLRDNFTVNMLQRRGSNTGYRIKEGKNVIGVEITEDDSNLCTRLMPIGYDGLLLPDKYIDSPLIKKYSHPYIKILECKDIKLKSNESENDEGFETLEECYAEMRKRCTERFEIEKIDRSKINVKVDFVDLKNTTEYKKYSHLENIKMGDTVTFIYKNISYELRVIKTEYDPNKKKFTKLELGEFKGNYITNSNKSITNIVKLETENIGKNLLTQAKDDATKQIKNALGGYIYKTQNELFIMDTNDTKTAKKVWRWNLNGLAYSDKGIEGPYKVAITQDGQIVGDFITSGTIATDRIEGLTNTLESFSKIILEHNKISMIVKDTIDITQEIHTENETDLIQLDNCMEGPLSEFQIAGNNTVFSGTEFNSNTTFNKDTTFTAQSSIFYIITDNVCSKNKDDYVLGAYAYKTGEETNHTCYIRNKKLFEINKKFGQLKVSVDEEYRVSNLYYFDKENNYLGDNNHTFAPNNKISDQYEFIIDIPSDAKYMGYAFKNKNTPPDSTDIVIGLDEIEQINPKFEYINKVDLGLNEPLRCHKEILEDEKGNKYVNTIRDKIIIRAGACTLLRRVGVDNNRKTYKLDEEISQELVAQNLYLLKGTNYIKLHNYSTYMYAKYIKTNEFTNLFQSQVEMDSVLEVLSNRIGLAVQQGNLISSLNLAIENGEGIISVKGNIMEIITDYFKLYRNGYFEAISGKIGNWILTSSHLYSNAISSTGQKIQSGFYSKDDMSPNAVFLYAGLDVTDGLTHYLSEANTYITNQGLINAKWFRVNGEKGFFYIDYNSGRRALDLYSNGVAWYLDDDTNNKWFSIYRNGNGQWFDLRDAPFMGIWDSLHSKNIATFYRLDPNSEYRAKNTAVIDSYADIIAQGTREDGVNHSFFINSGGKLYEVATNPVSDRRLKKRIKKSVDSALEIVKKIEVCKFQWKKPRYHKRKSVDFGYIAQQVQEVLKSLVIYNHKEDTYQIDELGISALHTKAIQEVDKKNDDLENKYIKLENKYTELKKEDEEKNKIIDFLITKLDCKDELKNYLKGEK